MLGVSYYKLVWVFYNYETVYSYDIMFIFLVTGCDDGDSLLQAPTVVVIVLYTIDYRIIYSKTIGYVYYIYSLWLILYFH